MRADKRRITFSSAELGLLAEAVNYHYLTHLSGYGVPVGGLSETEAEMHVGMVALDKRLQRLTEES